MLGTLYLVGTPIGNRGDITLRALRTLFSVDVILAEDTRTTSRLLSLYDNDFLNALGVERGNVRLERFDEAVERKKASLVIGWLREGKRVALVSESGMPLISDPGYVLLRECIKKGIQVEVVPGVSALTAAVAVAGLPVDQVLFLGFLAKKSGKRRKVYEALRHIRLTQCRQFQSTAVIPTVVIYESPFRLRRTVGEIEEELDDPELVLVGELTKMHEKVLRGKASDVLSELPEKIKGEWVIVINLRLKKRNSKLKLRGSGKL